MRLRAAGAFLKSLKGSFFWREGGRGRYSSEKSNRCKGGRVKKMVAGGGGGESGGELYVFLNGALHYSPYLIKNERSLNKGNQVSHANQVKQGKQINQAHQINQRAKHANQVSQVGLSDFLFNET